MFRQQGHTLTKHARRNDNRIEQLSRTHRRTCSSLLLTKWSRFERHTRLATLIAAVSLAGHNFIILL
jgi:hypothetical protein